jgi:hypothetical protein
MTLTEVGFYAQLKGKLTKKPYKCATIFINHYSCLCFLHLQINNQQFIHKDIFRQPSLQEYAAEHSNRILHHHCNNRQFRYNSFLQACHDAQKKLTFCGVNVHFQNGIAEQAIRHLSESACKQLLHACARWPKGVHFAL